MAWLRAEKSKGDGVQDRMRTVRQVSGDDVRMHDILPGGEFLWFICHFFFLGLFLGKLEDLANHVQGKKREGGRGQELQARL